MHGNEVLGRELLLKLADFLCESYLHDDPKIRLLIDHTRIHLMPSMNPDGWQLATETVSTKYHISIIVIKKLDLKYSTTILKGSIYILEIVKFPIIFFINILI